jgi:benzoylformate decarboxylase
MTIMKGHQALIQVLRQEGVKYIFGIPGATEVIFMDALEDVKDIQYILGLQEVVSVGMAEGYARASGRPGYLFLHTYTGLAAGLPLLFNAADGHVPLIVTAGQQDLRLFAQDPSLQEDLVSIARPCTKWATQIYNAADIPMVMRRAFKIALHPPQGPVFVALPQNLMNEDLDFEFQIGDIPSGNNLPDPRTISKAADLLLQSRHPVILVEEGITENQALSEVTALAEMCGAKVYQHWMSDVNFPVNHPLYMGDLDTNHLTTRTMFEQFDVMIVLGSRLFSQAFHLPKSLLPPGVKVIQIDDDDWQIGKNFPVDVAIECNLKIALTALNQAYQAGTNPVIQSAVRERYSKISAESQQAARKLADKAAAEFIHVPIAPSRLMREIKDTLPAGAIVVDDSWSNSGLLRHTLAFSQPNSYMRSRRGGSIGWGLPGAAGVQLANPDRPVVCVSGDGSAAWSIQSLWSAAHYNLPVTFIICANAAYRQVRVMKKLAMAEQGPGRNLGSELTNPRIGFTDLARGFGLEAVRVEDPARLQSALSQAFRCGRPNLVEVILDDSL